MITAKRLYSFIIVLLILSTLSYSQVTSAGSGNWSEGSTWVGGVAPGTGANVVIADGHEVTMDTDATVNNLTVEGLLDFENVNPRTLTVNGNIVADSIKTTSVTSGPLIHYIVVHGDLIIQSYFDLRSGSNPNVGAADLTFTGSTNSNVSGPSSMDVNGVTIDKSGGAKVILGSDFIQNNNSSNFPLGILNLTNGIIETGSYEWRVRSTGSAAGVQGGSATSYVNGTLVLYMPSGTPVKTYPLGDGENYRPLTVYLGSSVSNSGVRGSIVHGNANTGSSTLNGGIDKVSEIRYYVLQNISNNNLRYYSYAPSYGLDDGVNTGNSDLRVATSEDARTTWMDRGTFGTHVTDLSNPPTFIQSDSTALEDTLSSQEMIYITLARATGTTSNPLPVEMLSFSAFVIKNNVVLNWATATEHNSRGFEIEKSSDNEFFITVGFVSGAGTSAEKKEYSFIDEVLCNGDFYYRLKQVDFDGSFHYSEVAEVSVEIPAEFDLSQNYPNPFNPATTIGFQLNSDGEASLKIYDINGSLIKIVSEGFFKAGFHKVVFDAKGLPSGMYFYQLQQGTNLSVRKMILLK